MSTSYRPVHGSTGRVRGLLGAVLALVLGCLGMFAAQTAASAKSLDAITGVTITSEEKPSVGSSVRVEATWSAPGARSGDTFTLKLPTSPRFDGIRGTFDLKDSDDPDSTIGTCTVTTTEITCTFGAYADTHSGLSGLVYFWATAKEATEKDTVEFVTDGGVVFRAEIPGGGVGPKEHIPYVFPTNPFKDANVDHANDELEWAVYVPGAKLRDGAGNPITLTDTFDPRLTLKSTPQILVFTKAEWEAPVSPWGKGRYLTAEEYTYTPGAEPNVFELTVAASAIDSGNIYVIEYQTALPADVEEGDRFKNQAVGGGWKAEHTKQYYGAGGEGTGDALRAIQIVKAVAGDNPAAGPFEFQVSCVDADGATAPGFPQTVEVAVGAPASVSGVAVGWTCTVNETDAGGGAVTYDGPNVITIGADSPEQIVVTATNTFTPAPTGGLELSKLVIGDGAGDVPSDTQYSVEYSYGEGDSAVTGVLAVTTDTKGVLEGLPIGTVVTLKELAPVDLDGVAWTAKSFTVNGEDVGDTAEVTIGEAAEVKVEVTNTAEPVVETPAPGTPTPSDAPTETAPAGGTPPDGPGSPDSPLAQTGATVAIVAAAAVLLVGAGGVLLMVRRRARA